MKRKKVSLSQDAVSINFLLIFKFRFGIKGLKYHHSVTLSFFFCICISGANGERFPKNDITFSHVRACERTFLFLHSSKLLAVNQIFTTIKKTRCETVMCVGGWIVLFYFCFPYDLKFFLSCHPCYALSSLWCYSRRCCGCDCLNWIWINWILNGYYVLRQVWVCRI